MTGRVNPTALIAGLRHVVKDHVDLAEYPTADAWGDAHGAACGQDMAVYDLAVAIVGVLDNPPTVAPRDARRLITVCDACLQAACWQGEFYCDQSKTAGTVHLPVETLRKLDREHESYWEPARIARIEGRVP